MANDNRGILVPHLYPPSEQAARTATRPGTDTACVIGSGSGSGSGIVLHGNSDNDEGMVTSLDLGSHSSYNIYNSQVFINTNNVNVGGQNYNSSGADSAPSNPPSYPGAAPLNAPTLKKKKTRLTSSVRRARPAYRRESSSSETSSAPSNPASDPGSAALDVPEPEEQEARPGNHTETSSSETGPAPSNPLSDVIGIEEARAEIERQDKMIKGREDFIARKNERHIKMVDERENTRNEHTNLLQKYYTLFNERSKAYSERKMTFEDESVKALDTRIRGLEKRIKASDESIDDQTAFKEAFLDYYDALEGYRKTLRERVALGAGLPRSPSSWRQTIETGKAELAAREHEYIKAHDKRTIFCDKRTNKNAELTKACAELDIADDGTHDSKTHHVEIPKSSEKDCAYCICKERLVALDLIIDVIDYGIGVVDKCMEASEQVLRLQTIEAEQAELTSRDERIKALEAQKAQMAAEMKAERAKIQSQEQTIETQLAELDSKQEECINRTKAMEALQKQMAQIEQVRAKYNTQKETIDTLEAELASKKEEHNKATKAYAETLREHEEAGAKAEAQQQKSLREFEAARAENASQQQTIENLNSALASKEEEYTEAIKAHEETRQELQKLEDEVVVLRKKIESLESTLASRDERIKTLETQGRELDMKLKRGLKALQTTIGEMTESPVQE